MAYECSPSVSWCYQENKNYGVGRQAVNLDRAYLGSLLDEPRSVVAFGWVWYVILPFLPLLGFAALAQILHRCITVGGRQGGGGDGILSIPYVSGVVRVHKFSHSLSLFLLSVYFPLLHICDTKGERGY